MVDFGAKLKEQQGLKSVLEQVILTGQGTPKLLEVITFRHDIDKCPKYLANNELKWKTNFDDGDGAIKGCVWKCNGCGELVMSDEINNYYIDVAGPIKQHENHSMDSQNHANFILKCLDDEIDDDHKYTDWEREFVESVSKRVESGRDLSEKQEGVLERIYNKHN